MSEGIGYGTRPEIAKPLARLLGSTFILYLKTHGFHWNASGPEFPMLHEFFGKQYQELWEAVDTLAEHLRTMDVRAPGSCEEMIELSSRGVMDGGTKFTARAMVEQLLDDHETCIAQANEAMQPAQARDDQVTLNLLIDRCTAHKKAAWMLRSILRQS